MLNLIDSRDYSFLKTKLTDYNSIGPITSANWAITCDKMLIAICTSLMRRVHKTVPQAGEIVFIDSSITVDRDGHRIFILLTHNESCGPYTINS